MACHTRAPPEGPQDLSEPLLSLDSGHQTGMGPWPPPAETVFGGCKHAVFMRLENHTP